jgi:hypothetical protein
MSTLSEGRNGRPIDYSLSELQGEGLQISFNQMVTYFYVVASVEGPIFMIGPFVFWGK